jgi:2-succinyl-5-enolpyruvyl-6-hydroxy-3-cyclohexene-1-carboxylate synthase
VAEYGWPDPQGTARSLVVGDVGESLARLATLLEGGEPQAGSGAWSEVLARAGAAVWKAVDTVLSEETNLSEGAAVRAVTDALPPGTLLAIGNSLPVRHVDLFCIARSGGPAVWSQRGASGIDGVVSGAAGAAHAARRPTLLLVGDLSTRHDLGGFAAAAALDVPFVVVILNNDGGRLFEQLPLAESGVPEELLRFWTTPHGATFEGLASLFRVRYLFVRESGSLADIVRRELKIPGCAVVEVPVPQHGAALQYRAIARAVDLAVASIVHDQWQGFAS